MGICPEFLHGRPRLLFPGMGGQLSALYRRGLVPLAVLGKGLAWAGAENVVATMELYSEFGNPASLPGDQNNVSVILNGFQTSPLPALPYLRAGPQSPEPGGCAEVTQTDPHGPPDRGGPVGRSQAPPFPELVRGAGLPGLSASAALAAPDSGPHLSLPGFQLVDHRYR